MSGRPRDPYPQSPLARFRVYGSAAARRATTPPPTRTSCEPVRQPGPERRRDRHRATSPQRSDLEQHAALRTLWEPEMGANVFSRPRTQHDPIRFFSQVTSSQFDSVRRWQTLRNSLTRKRSLVQIQYGPPGISCSWPYQVALRGPTTALQGALPRGSSGQVRARELPDLGVPMEPGPRTTATRT
jgi:hypothetical protein